MGDCGGGADVQGQTRFNVRWQGFGLTGIHLDNFARLPVLRPWSKTPNPTQQQT